MSQRRPPLSDATDRVNNSKPEVQSPSASYPRPQSYKERSLPHHDSHKPHGNLLAPPVPPSPMTAVENKRLSALAQLDQRAANRASQVSIASTNATIASGNGAKRLKTHVGPWRLGKTLGKGATGRVRMATHKDTGQVAAIKIVSMKSAHLTASESIRGMTGKIGQPQNRSAVLPAGIEREMIIMQLIDHSNIISLYDVWRNRGELYLVLELVDSGDLFDYINHCGPFEQQEAVRMFRQLISGVAYCHRFKICHRDLKPENILIDQMGNLKIADFGMAALQPAGVILKTSCGSPHYASPEIAAGHPYHGHLADIWSCGIILYVMLAKRLPFGAERNPEMAEDEYTRWVLDEVKHADLVFEHSMSDLAVDFLDRVLQREPGKRMLLEQMWNHRLIAQYDGIAKKPENAGTWLGGPLEKLPRSSGSRPTTESGKPITKRSQIDENLLKSLCTLFYHMPEERVVGSLLDEKPNYEKYFYDKLKKFRDEHLEYYDGAEVHYSASDYHHVQGPVRRSSTRVSLQASPHHHRASQYSITADPVARVSQSYRRAPSSAADTDISYDPFRASRPQIVREADHAYITIHRSQSNASRVRSTTASVRRRALTRYQGDDGLSVGTSPVSMPSATALQIHQLRRERLVRNYSRSSLASSQRRQSNPSIVRPSASYKRGVSFIHIRRLSNSDAVPPVPNKYATPPTLKERYQRDRLLRSSPELSPPANDEYPLVRSRKRPSSQTNDQDVASRNPKRISQYWREDARKVSMELEKVCDEAFNESRVGKYSRSNTLLSIPEVDSPTKAQPPVPRLSRETREMLEQRPLPQPPTAETVTKQELARTMNLLKRQAADPQAGFRPGQLDDVIAHLERLMQPATRMYETDNDRRTASAPDAKFLSPVREEDVRSSWITEQSSPTKSRLSYRAVSEPMARYDPNRTPRPTIRKVDNDIYGPISPVQPLVIRKRSAGSTASNSNLRAQHNQGQLDSQIAPEVSPFHFNDSELNFSFKMPILEDVRPASFPEVMSKPLDDVFVDKDSRAVKAKSTEVKKRSWFTRSQPPAKKDPDQPPTPPAKNSPKKGDPKNTALGRKVSTTSSEEFPLRQSKKEKSTAKEKFLKIFSKRDSRDSKGSQGSKDFSTEDDVDGDGFAPSSVSYPYMSGALQNSSMASIARPMYGQPLFPPGGLPLDRTVQPAPQNWLARFLHIKPATKILCFQIGRMRALKEVSKAFREWRRYGMKDVIVDKSNFRVFTRVDASNHLNIRPVSIAVEFFPIFKHYRPTNTSIARFTQEQGAKSSFERVCKSLEQLLTGRDMMITDKKKKREMQACLAE